MALVLGSLLGTLVVCELAVRLFGWAPALDRIQLDDPDGVYERSDNPLLGYTLKRGYRGENRHPGFRRTNAHGLRDVERAARAAPGTRRVIVLGDSVVAGHGIRELDATITRQTERLLAERGVEVLNFGVGGYCTRGEVALLEERGLELAPDAVVVLFVENDWDDLNSELGQLRHRTPRPGWVESLFVGSHLFRTVSLRLDWWSLRSDAEQSTDTRDSPDLGPHMDAMGDDNVSAGLKRLAELSKEHGFATLIALWPAFTRAGLIHRDRDGAVQPQGQLRVEQLARRNGLRAVRLGPAMARVLAPAGPSAAARLSHDGMHPTPRGASVAAKALAPLIDQLLAP